jgi:regulator of cell morphogenesis and NO signaling
MTTRDELEMRSATVADVAVSFPQALGVLNRYRLDYCCNGGRQFVAACDSLKLDAGLVWQEILEAAEQPAIDKGVRFNTWGTPLLIDYIVEHHHGYVRQSTGRILELLKKVERAHSEENAEVVQVRQAFEQLSEELLEHMIKEEVIVFPTVRRIAESEGAGLKEPLATSIEAPLIAMEDDHEQAGMLIKQLRSLTQMYTPPLYACPTFQLTWRLLKEFDDDLMKHIHLENNILFPRVREAG